MTECENAKDKHKFGDCGFNIKFIKNRIKYDRIKIKIEQYELKKQRIKELNENLCQLKDISCQMYDQAAEFVHDGMPKKMVMTTLNVVLILKTAHEY